MVASVAAYDRGLRAGGCQVITGATTRYAAEAENGTRTLNVPVLPALAVATVCQAAPADGRDCTWTTRPSSPT
ncbi:hypothetical protein [Actinoplanes sp. NPDC026619]|uniref:hypothetical protein n=1 Tax=Actinoplanes sp. NPDC026619 TaxID=3155798 RepID=UPI003411C0AD